MRHHLLLVMSLSGTTVVALYGLFYPVIKRYVPISWQKAILKFAIFIYLFPLPLFKEAIVSFIRDVFPVFAMNGLNIQESEILDLNYAINLLPGNIFFGSEVLLIGVFLCCMGAITFFIIAKQLKQYLAISKAYLSTAFSEEPPPALAKQLQQIKTDLKIRSRVRLVCSQFCKAPITIGVFFPTIIFPMDDAFNLEPVHYTYVLKHELLHIKSRDSLVRLLSLAVLALHWYNPVCYFLYRETRVVCEMNCDHEVVKDFDEILRQDYSNLILELATKDYMEKEKFALGLSNGDAKALKRRILEMKTSRKSKAIVSVAVVLAICLAGSLTAFAYEAPQTHRITDFDPNHSYLFSSDQEVENRATIPYNLFFIDNEGNIYPLEEIPNRIGCKHTRMIEGTLSDHCKNSNGGCVTIVKKAWRCADCGHIETGDIISETKYTVCPH